MAYPYTRYRADWVDDDPTKPVNGDALDTIEAGIKSISDIVVPNTLVDNKGDILAASAADTVGRKAVGTNSKVLQADSSQVYGLIWDFIKNVNVDAAAGIAVSKLEAGSAGQFLGGTGPSYSLPPGAELDFAQVTSDVSITATSSAAANTVVSGASVAYDGTAVWVNFFAPGMIKGTGMIRFVLYDGATQLGQFLGTDVLGDTNSIFLRTKITPSVANHQYIMKAWVDAGTGTVKAGTGASGAYVPAWISVVKV